MSPRNVLHVLSLLWMFEAGAMLLPLPFSFYYGDGDYTALLLAAGITLLAGLIGFFLTRMDQDLRPKDGFAIVTFGWISFSLFGSLPFLLSGTIPAFTDAFFETMSGFTTTGATVLTDIESVSHGILFWRSLTHWVGGMGIIVLSLAILPFLGVGGMQLFKAEVPGPTADKLTPRVTETAKILWGVYVFISLLETVLLLFGGMNLFDALCHTFGTMATGGFSTRNASIGAYDNMYIDYVIIVFMLLAGTNFTLHYRFLTGEFTSYFRSREFLFYLSLIGVGFILVGLDTFFHVYRSWLNALQQTLFQVVSIMTTTGYVTADYEHWGFSAQLTLFFLMFVGGCAGSTGGSLKVIRIFVIMKLVYAETIRLIHPHAVVPVRIGGTVIPREVLTNILGLFALFVGIFVAGTLIMAGLGLNMDTAMGSVAATLGNIGPGLGGVGPTDNYAHIPVLGKWMLCAFMLMGRLEVFTVIVLLSPAFWKK